MKDYIMNITMDMQVGTERDTLSALGRLLRAPTHTPPIEKMLTPVQEKQYETDSSSSDDDDDRLILTSSSQKLDGAIMSRSESGFSNPSISWTLFDVDSEVSSLRDSISLLSDGDDTLPRGYRLSAHSISGSHDTRKLSKDECPQISSEHEDVEHKDSSQGSDDSSAFAENNQGLFLSCTFSTSPPFSPSSFPSSTEGTPIRTMSESRGRYDIPSHLLYSTGRDRPRQTEASFTHNSSSLRSQYASTQSSQTSQGSISESFESPDATLKASNNKYSRYERYERFSQSNSPSENGSNRDLDVEVTIEQSQSSTHSTEGSIGTVTDDVLPEDENKTVSAEDQNRVSNETKDTDTDTLYQNGEIVKGREDPESKSKANHQIEHSEMLKEIQKQLDSGIDERGSPDTKSDRGNSLPRSSLPDGVSLRQNITSRCLSNPVSFNSRESGLADSPDPDSFLNEPHTLNGLHSHPQALSVTDTVNSPVNELAPQLQFSDPKDEHSQQYEVPQSKLQSEYVSSRDRRSKSSESDFGHPHILTHVEMIPHRDDNPKLIQQTDMSDSNDSISSAGNGVSDFNLPLSTSVPRNFESPSFSNIARNPIRLAESRHTKTSDNPLYDVSDRRQRSCSVEPQSLPPNSHASQHEPSNRASLKSKSTTSASPAHSASISQCTSGIDLSSHSKAGLSKSLSALTFPPLEGSFEGSPNSSLKRKKWGKRLHKTFKPALRVLKITPNSTVTINSQEQDDVFQDVHLSSRSPEPSPSPAEIEAGRVRMISPETVSAASKKRLTRTMRRSQSFDDLLGTSNHPIEGGATPLKVGSVHVLPETKTKTKMSKFFSSFQGLKSRSKGRLADESPVVLVEVRKKKHSGELLAAVGDGSTKSPKTKKRSRLPHFV